MADFYRASSEGHKFFHFGYAFRSIWMDLWPPEHVRELQQVGFHIDRQLAIAAGRTAALMRLTREEALASDGDAAEELHLSEDAIKKRWRSIYAKVEIADPGLLDSSESGAARRRSLLQYLRKHLEELRPYEEA